jgi:hypothetical protein
MTTTYRIEKNVPLPEGRRPIKSELRLSLESMKVGDSILIPRTEVCKADAAFNALRALGKRFSTRAIDEGIRIWRRE